MHDACRELRQPLVALAQCFAPQQQHKLVAANSGNRVCAEREISQSTSDFTQHFVAHGVTMGIVDRFESVQINQQQREVKQREPDQFVLRCGAQRRIVLAHVAPPIVAIHH